MLVLVYSLTGWVDGGKVQLLYSPNSDLDDLSIGGPIPCPGSNSQIQFLFLALGLLVCRNYQCDFAKQFGPLRFELAAFVGIAGRSERGHF